MDDNLQAVSALANAQKYVESGHYADAVKVLMTVRSRSFVAGHVDCINLLAHIVCRKSKDHDSDLIQELKRNKNRLSTSPDCEKYTEAIVHVLLSNVNEMLEKAAKSVGSTLEKPSIRDEEFGIISGIRLDTRAKERFFTPCLGIVNRLASELLNFGVYGSFVGISKNLLRVYNSTAIKFISICETYELDRILDRIADSIARTFQKVFLDPLPQIHQNAQQGGRNNVAQEIQRSRRDFYSNDAAGEDTIHMLSQLAETLAKRQCWRHLWTIVTCIHKISKGFSDSASVMVAAFECNAKVFWTCGRWDFHAYCLSRAAQMDPSTFATRAVIAALCAHDDDKQYDPFEAVGININATISAVFDDPNTDNESLLSRLLVPRIIKFIHPTALTLVHQLRKSTGSTDYRRLVEHLSQLLTSVPESEQYQHLLRQTILRRQVEDMSQQNNLVEVNHLFMDNLSGNADKDYVDFVEPVILQDTGVPVDIDCKNGTISFRNSAKKKLNCFFSKLASMTAMKPGAATVEVRDSLGVPHIMPASTPSVSVADLNNATERGRAFFRLQELCRTTQETRKEQRQKELQEEKEKVVEEKMQREKQKQEQYRKSRLAKLNEEKREKARQQGLLNVIKLLRKKYPGLQVEDALSAKKTTVFEDELTQIVADFKRKKAESSQKETLVQNLQERTLRRLDIPKRKEFDEKNAERHKAERAAAKENFLAQHRREYEKRQKERAVLQTFLEDAEAFERDVIQRSMGEKSSKRDEQQSLLEQEMRRLANQ
eukprot:gene11247-7815_t